MLCVITVLLTVQLLTRIYSKFFCWSWIALSIFKNEWFLSLWWIPSEWWHCQAFGDEGETWNMPGTVNILVMRRYC